MWKDSGKGYAAEFVSKKGEVLTVEIQKNNEAAVVKRDNTEHVIMGMRNNEVKIYNDLFFDENATKEIKNKMAQVCKKKVEATNKKRK